MKDFRRIAQAVSVAILLVTWMGYAQQTPSSKVSSGITPSAQPVPAATTTTPVVTTGGKNGLIPVFTDASTVGQSIIYQYNGGIGIGTVPSALFDVNGTSIYRGILDVARTANATPTAGTGSWPFRFSSQQYNSSAKTTVNTYFQLQAEATGNNTASTGATLNLLYYNGGGPNPAETGFYFNPNGTVHFASAQTFPITTGPAGPTGPQGPAGPSGPTGPAGPAGLNTLQLFTSTSLLQTFAANTDQFGPVMGVSNAIAASDYYGQFRNSLIFPNACTASNFKVNLGFESLTNPFVLTSTLRVSGTNTPLTCDSGFANGYSFSCTSSATFAIPAGAQVVLDFSHTGTNPANVFPQVTFQCQ